MEQKLECRWCDTLREKREDLNRSYDRCDELLKYQDLCRAKIQALQMALFEALKELDSLKGAGETKTPGQLADENRRLESENKRLTSELTALAQRLSEAIKAKAAGKTTYKKKEVQGE
jgi:regulator of replication initiation timing